MKSVLKWLKSNKSDFILFIIIIVLVNLISVRAFVRLDLTAPQSYSLSESSKQLVKNLENNMSVKMFFSNNLPSPYNSVSQYLNDLLIEYKGVANDNFSFEKVNMDDPENETLARNYRLQQIQIQEIKDNEVGFKNAWMGIVLIYSDQIEVIDGLSSSEGLEYKITSKMSKMISTASTLAGLQGRFKLSLYLSDDLADFNIGGFNDVESTVSVALGAINYKNMNKIDYVRVNPKSEEISTLTEKYGLQSLQWKNDEGLIEQGTIGLVLEYGNRFMTVPLQMAQSLFGGYSIAGLDSMEQSIEDSLKSLALKSPEIGYISGHGELDLNDAQSGAGNFSKLMSDWYSLKTLNLADEDIPLAINTIIINGPKTSFSEAELYKIDQFVLKGGNVALFLDPFNEEQVQGGGYYGAPPTYVKNETGLEKLLKSYGVTIPSAYVLDTESYSSEQQGYGKVNFYYAPLIQQNRLNQKSPISANLAYVLFLQTGGIELVEKEGVSATILAKTTEKSWTMSENIMLNPLYLSPPAEDKMAVHNLAVLLEGTFSSAFTDAPESTQGVTSEKIEKTSSNLTQTSAHIAKGSQSAKIFVVPTSLVTTGAVIDSQGAQPVAMLLRNAIDDLMGNADLARMRTKGLSLNTLEINNPAWALIAKAFNQYGLPILVVIAGLLVWQARMIRRKKIKEEYDSKGAKDE